MKPMIGVLLCFILLTPACKEDADPKTTCGVEDSLEELEWLAAEIADIQKSSLAEYFYVTKATYNGGTVFIIGNCCPHCGTVAPVYDCNGNRLGNVGDQKINPGLLENDILVWAPDNSSCNFN